MVRIERRIVASVEPSPATPRKVARAFGDRLRAGARLRPAGSARARPSLLLARGYQPRYAIDLFDTTFYLTGVRQNDDIRFFVAYVVQPRRPRDLYPRIFYKDVSLVWRSASHYARSHGENWIGKGDVRVVVEEGEEFVDSAEATTDLPLEMQTALETLCRAARRIPRDEEAVGLILRRAPDDRIEPYRDFTDPRRRAAADPRNLVNGGRSVARFRRRNDPTSLEFTAGFEPDFEDGVLETAGSTSRLYGGALQRFRIASRNREAQYLFFAAPRQAWIGACQATTTELSSYGVRTVDVVVDEDLLIPGYEYHFVDESEEPPRLHSQIPAGFVGEPSEVDAARSDASPWLERLPVIREFRSRVLSARPRGAGSQARFARGGRR